MPQPRMKMLSSADSRNDAHGRVLVGFVPFVALDFIYWGSCKMIDSLSFNWWDVQTPHVRAKSWKKNS